VNKVSWAALQALHNQEVSVAVQRKGWDVVRQYFGTVKAFDDVVSIVDHPAEGLSSKLTIEPELDAEVRIYHTTAIAITLPKESR